MTRVLVTGGTGCIGAATVRALVDRGADEVELRFVNVDWPADLGRNRLVSIHLIDRDTEFRLWSGDMRASPARILLTGERAAIVDPDEEVTLRRGHEDLKRRYENECNKILDVTQADVEEVISRWTGIPVSKMLESEREKLVRMEDAAGNQMRGFSRGMLQRMGIAQALVHSPRILILDEPTAGLDPLQADGLRDLLGGLPAGVTLVLATHLLDDVTALCGRVALLETGRKVAEHAVTPGLDLMSCLRRNDHDESAA